MERMAVLSTNRPDWPVIQDLVIASRAEVEKNEMNKLEWNFTVAGSDGGLSALRDQLAKKTPKTICMGISPFSKLLFTIECKPKELHPKLDEIGRQFHVEIRVGHLSENGWHISIEDTKEVLEKIKDFLSQKDITASLF